MKTSFDWAKAAFAALVFLALPFMLAGFLANFVWFGITIGLKLFAELSEWALGRDELDAETRAILESLDEEWDELERFESGELTDLPEWMRD